MFIISSTTRDVSNKKH